MGAPEISKMSSKPSYTHAKGKLSDVDVFFGDGELANWRMNSLRNTASLVMWNPMEANSGPNEWLFHVMSIY